MTLQTELLSTAARMIETAAGMIDMAKTLGGDTTGSTSPPTPTNAFPADPGAAPFPSPENSTSAPLAGKISGAPYLRSSQGAVYQFDRDAGGNLIPLKTEYSTGYQVSVNGVPVANAPMQMLMVRQGQVYFQADTIWSKLTVVDSAVAGITHTVPPQPWTATGTVGGHTVSLPAMPAGPAPSAIAPGSTGKVILFGNAQPFKTPQEAHDAASPGDTITVGAEMHERTEPYTLDITKPIAVDFGGRVLNAGTEAATFIAGLALDVSSLSDPDGYPHQLGAIVVHTDAVIRGLRCTGAGMKEPTHGGTAAIRVGAPCNLVVENCHLIKNQNGIGPSGYPHTLVATNTILEDNGLGPNDGGSHNVYAANGPDGGCVSATFGPGFTSIVTQGGGGGHAVKSRANVTKLVAPFYIYAADSSTLDLPDGSTQVVQIGAGTIAKKPGDANHVVIGYGVESQTNGLAGVSIAAGATIDAQCDSPIIQTLGDMAIEAGVIFKGTKPTVQGGGTVKGLPA